VNLGFGFSPCPNDTFSFDALVHGRIAAPFTATPALHDIEDLNALARAGRYELTKLSFGALAGLRDSYTLLRSGAALGRGCGPLVVAREPASLAQATAGRVAIPGWDTTAFLLLRLAAPALGEIVETRYDRILDAVASGEVDAGLIIHESRFTYAGHGLVEIADLGAWWEAETGLPIPLGAICARTDIGPDLIAACEDAVRRSVEYAFAHPLASLEYVRAHSQELSDEVCRRHIDLYVNEFTIDLGDDGMAAVDALLARAAGTPA
jgi:1,4-dihydroxy-6-naphthoate synthase